MYVYSLLFLIMEYDKTDKLIQLIRDSYPGLYNTKHRDYTKAKKKEHSFEEIAKILNYGSGAVVKSEWTTLRNRHREALRRQRQKRSVDASYRIKLWQYQDQMSFLLPFMRNPDPNSISSAWDDDYETQQLYKRLKQEDSPYLDDTDEPQELENFHVDKDDLYDDADDASKRSKGVMKRTASEEDVFDPLRKTDEVTDVAKRPKEDALYYFFMSMYQETKKMPTSVQCRIKKNIFEVINGEEEKLLVDKSVRDCAGSESTSGKRSNMSSPSSVADESRS